MDSKQQTTSNQADGVAGLLQRAMQTGLGVTESMHQFAVEIPLSMVPDAIASEEQTSALKDKHRSLLRGVYGSIDSVASKALVVGAETVAGIASSITASDYDAEATSSKASKAKEVSQA